MSSPESFHVLSPSLGCPRLIPRGELLSGKPLAVLIASNRWQDCAPRENGIPGSFSLRPSASYAARGQALPAVGLRLAGPPQELTDWDALGAFRDAEDTQWRISRELHYGVLGRDTRYWRVELVLEAPGALPSPPAGRRAVLYDLVWSAPDGGIEQTSLHSVQVMERADAGLTCLHVTDLHVARRNDEMLGEVLKNTCPRPGAEIERDYVNFNENFRRFIRHANALADRGELDFVVITGDLVDFAHHGWRDGPCLAQNNWKTFVNILAGTENREASEGLKVAAFTALGNHDWRLHPYNPCLAGMHGAFGLRKEELQHYPYRGFFSADLKEDDPRRKTVESLDTEIFSHMNTSVLDKVRLALARLLLNNLAKYLPGAGLVLGAGASTACWWTPWISAVAGGGAAALVWLAGWYLKSKLRETMDLVVDNSLHGGPTALAYYLKYINPYFDYAFRLSDHWFVVMDTGADVFTGQLLDNKERSQLRRLSMEDNILGGSPDSRAFEGEQKYYDWSQIVWLEKVLGSSGRKDAAGRTLLFLHAPPINTDKGNDYVATNLSESRRPADRKWIPFEECNLTYGTINHYLSQFFYLCLGRRESHLKDPAPAREHPGVDLVLAGHAHRNIEFRIALDASKVRIYADRYSDLLARAAAPADWWKDKSTVIVQTAACGPKGESDLDPPYFRRIRINAQGAIEAFKVEHL
jgi:predicted MPP superfamily phosphohydrolase